MDELSALNHADEDQAVALLEPLIERAPEIARRVAGRRPFRSTDDLREAIRCELLALDDAQRVGLFRAHPELAPENPLSMTSASQAEQGRFRLTTGTNEYQVRLAELNARYRAKFGFPFITALVRHRDIDSVLKEFEARISADRKSEIGEAIYQIFAVSSSRVGAAFGEGNADRTHDAALDT